VLDGVTGLLAWRQCREGHDVRVPPRGRASASEVGREISEHTKHAGPHERRGRLVSITEAVVLAVVTLLAAWSGYAAAKWSTESRYPGGRGLNGLSSS
jgi:hypothetical protein